MANVEVYWNLHKKLYSVRQSGKVVDHLPALIIKKPRFVVQPAGNAKVVNTGVKNVHAFVRGAIEQRRFWWGDELKLVNYNPFQGSYFYYADTKTQIVEAPIAYLTSIDQKPKVWVM